MIQIDKATLIDALKKVMPGVEKGKTSIDGADQLLFSGTAVSSYNSEIAVTAPCDTQGISFSVKGADFFSLVSKLSDVTLSLDIVDNKVKMKGGRTKASMAMLDVSKVADLVNALNLGSVQYKNIPEGFVDGVRLCSLAGNTDNIRGVAVGDYEDSSAIFETDTTRICINKLPEQMDTFWVDDTTFKNALSVGTPTMYSVDGAWLHLKYEDGTVFSAKRKDHSAYPFEGLIRYPANVKTAEVLVEGKFPTNIAEAVSRVAILASGSDKNARLVQMTFRKEELELYAEKDGGEASEIVPLDAPLENDPNGVQVWVDTAFLLEASNKVMAYKLCNVDNGDGTKSIALVFQSGNYIQFVEASVGS